MGDRWGRHQVFDSHTLSADVAHRLSPLDHHHAPMSSSPFRWRRASRKSSIPFFPGAWPNNSAHDSISTKGDTVESINSVNHRATQLVQTTSSLASESSHRETWRTGNKAIHRNSDEPLLEYIDHATDFRRQLSLPFPHLQTDSIGSIPTGTDIPTDNSRMDALSSSSGTTIATPSPLSPTASLSFPLSIPPDVEYHHKDTFSLPRVITQHNASSHAIHPSTSTCTSAQLDSPLLSLGHGLSQLSLPLHTFSLSPQSAESHFSFSKQTRSIPDPAMSPPLPSPHSSITPASLIIPSPVHDYASLPEIPSSNGFATSFYPVLDSNHENDAQEIHDLLSIAPSGSSRVYDGDSPVLPSDEEISPKFLSPLLSPQQRDGLSPSTAEMDAFGLAAARISDDTRSDLSIPTSLQSQFVAEPGIRKLSFGDGDETLRPCMFGHNSRSLSLSPSISSIGTLSLDRSFSRNLERHKRRSEPPLSLPVQEPVVPSETVATSSAVNIRPYASSKPSSLEKVKKFGGKLKRLFSFKDKFTGSDGSGIGVTRSTQVTNIEYASEHPISLSETRSAKPSPILSSKRAKRARRQSLPVLSAPSSNINVSSPRPLRPISFLSIDPAQSSSLPSHGLLSPSKLKDIQHTLGSKVRNKSSLQFSRNRASTSEFTRQQPNGSTEDTKGKSAEKPLPPVPVTPSSRERRRSEFVTPTAKPMISPKKPRRFSMSPGFAASRMDHLRSTVTPHPPLPQNVARSSQEVRDGVDPGMVRTMSEMVSKKKKAGDSSRMVKARSMVVGNIHYRKPVPTMDNVGDQNITSVPISEPGSATANGLLVAEYGLPRRDVQKEGLQPSFLDKPPVLQRALPLTERSLDQKSKRRSRGFSFTSNVSKRAQQARSMIVGRSERDALHSDFASRKPYKRSNTSETRGSSLGCADYEPDLIPDDMSFAPRPGLPSGSSVTSLEELTLGQESLEKPSAHCMLSKASRTHEGPTHLEARGSPQM
ncbi:hypothetical protein BDY19DRAFT_988481 [Irpex rosettiformis]|uniref:Uncharacterized protein n=1 Tax=Irpex rosettiformis TaxID=378272 RepID=A0ACB8UKK5_9APHY|nr:hypothetical protein BDY19DRAFT_988481 [Irpex rosettiformis]